MTPKDRDNILFELEDAIYMIDAIYQKTSNEEIEAICGDLDRQINDVREKLKELI